MRSPAPYAARMRPSGSPSATFIASFRRRGVPEQGGSESSTAREPSMAKTLRTPLSSPVSRETTIHPPELRRCAASSTGELGTKILIGTPFTAFKSGATSAMARGAGSGGRATACICCGAGLGDGGLGAARGGSFGGGAGFGGGVSMRTGLGIRTTRMRRSFSGCTGFGRGGGSGTRARESHGNPAISASAQSAAARIATDRNRRGGSARRRLCIRAHPDHQLRRIHRGHLREARIRRGPEMDHHHLPLRGREAHRIAGEHPRAAVAALHVDALLAHRSRGGLRFRRRQAQEQELRREKLRHHHQSEERQRELLLGEEPVDERFHLLEPRASGSRSHGFPFVASALSTRGGSIVVEACFAAISSSTQAGQRAEVGRRSSRTSALRYESSPRRTTDPRKPRGSVPSSGRSAPTRTTGRWSRQIATAATAESSCGEEPVFPAKTSFGHFCASHRSVPSLRRSARSEPVSLSVHDPSLENSLRCRYAPICSEVAREELPRSEVGSSGSRSAGSPAASRLFLRYRKSATPAAVYDRSGGTSSGASVSPS